MSKCLPFPQACTIFTPNVSTQPRYIYVAVSNQDLDYQCQWHGRFCVQLFEASNFVDICEIGDHNLKLFFKTSN